ncbi:hypothetical protein [Ekhidna sp.]
MNTQNFLRIISMMVLFISITAISSCGSDDEEAGPDEIVNDEVSLEFTLDGTKQTAVFNSGSSFLALSDGESSVLSGNGSLVSGQNYAVAIAFVGTSNGTYTLTNAAGEDDENTNGMSLIILNGQNSVGYNAKNVTLEVTSYTVISLGQIVVKGTFSGTLENEDTLEEVSITNGSFVTGFTS